MNRYFSLKAGVLVAGLVASSMCPAVTYLQSCGSGSTSISCGSSESLGTTHTDQSVYDILKPTGCGLTEQKLSAVNSNVGVDTYSCLSGDFQGLSFQIFHNRSTRNVYVIVVY